MKLNCMKATSISRRKQNTCKYVSDKQKEKKNNNLKQKKKSLLMINV